MASLPPQFDQTDIEGSSVAFSTILNTANTCLINLTNQIESLVNKRRMRDSYPDLRHRSSRPKSHHRHRSDPIKVPTFEPIKVPVFNWESFLQDNRSSIPETAPEKEKESSDEDSVAAEQPPETPQEAVPIEPLHEANPVVNETELPEPDLAPIIEVHEEVIIDPSKSVEVKTADVEEDVSVAIAPKTPNQVVKTPVVYYPFELDEVTLIWKRSQQYPSEFGVNSGSSSFQVGVTDTDRFRAVLVILKDFRKPRKRDRKKTEHAHLIVPRGAKNSTRGASRPLDHLISPDLIAMISLFKYFIS